MRSEDLIARIEQIANPAWQAAWDLSGCQVASTRPEVRRLGIFLDPVPSQVRRALEAGCDFLLSHHPLSLKPQLPAVIDSYFQVLQLLMRANVWLYAAHTSLDVNLEGPSGWLARSLELEDWHPLEALPTPELLGYGVIGNLPEGAPVGELIGRILQLTKIECGSVCGPEATGLCKRVAICGGSGASLLKTAYEKGADLYVTGDIKYHDALESRVITLDVGHHSLEEEMMRRLAMYFSETLTEIQVEFFPSRTPFRRACQ